MQQPHSMQRSSSKICSASSFSDVYKRQAYAFLSNLASVVLAPLVLPLIATGQIDTPFLETMSNVFMRVGPTMLFPLLAAWLIQYAAPKVNAVLLRWGILAYYLWAGMLVILMGGTFEQLIKPGDKD